VADDRAKIREEKRNPPSKAAIMRGKEKEVREVRH